MFRRNRNDYENRAAVEKARENDPGDDDVIDLLKLLDSSEAKPLHTSTIFNEREVIAILDQIVVSNQYSDKELKRRKALTEIAALPASQILIKGKVILPTLLDFDYRIANRNIKTVEERYKVLCNFYNTSEVQQLLKAEVIIPSTAYNLLEIYSVKNATEHVTSLLAVFNSIPVQHALALNIISLYEVPHGLQRIFRINSNDVDNTIGAIKKMLEASPEHGKIAYAEKAVVGTLSAGQPSSNVATSLMKHINMFTDVKSGALTARTCRKAAGISTTDKSTESVDKCDTSSVNIKRSS